MNAGTLNSLSSYMLYNFIETQAVGGTSSVTEKPCTIVSLSLRNLEIGHVRVHYDSNVMALYIILK